MRDGGPTTIGLLDHMGYGNLCAAAIQEAVRAPEPGETLAAQRLQTMDTE